MLIVRSCQSTRRRASPWQSVWRIQRNPQVPFAEAALVSLLMVWGSRLARRRVSTLQSVLKLPRNFQVPCCARLPRVSSSRVRFSLDIQRIPSRSLQVETARNFASPRTSCPTVGLHQLGGGGRRRGTRTHRRGLPGSCPSGLRTHPRLAAGAEARPPLAEAAAGDEAGSEARRVRLPLAGCLAGCLAVA